MESLKRKKNMIVLQTKEKKSLYLCGAWRTSSNDVHAHARIFLPQNGKKKNQDCVSISILLDKIALH